MLLLDAVARRLPGALAEGSGELESFSAELEGGLEYPHYTRPAEFRGWEVPPVLTDGDHARIRQWRHRKALEKTLRNRPDLLERTKLSAEDEAVLKELRAAAAERRQDK